MVRLIMCLLVLAPSIGFSNHYLDGVWVNDNLGKKIELFSDGDKLDVYGVKPHRQNRQVFWRISKRRYEDRYGNRIKIEDDGCLEFRYNYSLRKIRFRKAAPPHRDRVAPPPRGRHQGGYDRGHKDHHNTGRFSLEGRWYSPKTDRSLQVVEEKYGFSIKFDRDGDWKYFEKVSERTYRDRKGNTYVVNGDGTMTWRSFDRDRTITIHREGR